MGHPGDGLLQPTARSGGAGRRGLLLDLAGRRRRGNTGGR
ncbi:hypothetical protein STIAU_4024, partial [Stigmatella aurantiaca DW4/3-1]